MNIFAEVLDRTNEWLKFAEAKNGLLTAGATTLAVASVRLLFQPDLSLLVKIYLCQLAAFAIIGATLGLVSFLPALRFSTVLIGNAATNQDNLLFFGHLATLRPLKLAQALRSSVSPPLSEEPIQKCYAEQIIVNSRIALVKYSLFEWGLRALIVALLTPVFGLVILLIANGKDTAIND